MKEVKAKFYYSYIDEETGEEIEGEQILSFESEEEWNKFPY